MKESAASAGALAFLKAVAEKEQTWLLSKHGLLIILVALKSPALVNSDTALS